MHPMPISLYSKRPDVLRFTGGQKVKLPGAKEVELAGGKIWAGKEDALEIKKQCSLEEAQSLKRPFLSSI